jgi:hypothetical protein
MLTEELGFKDLIDKIFGIKEDSGTSLLSSTCFEGDENHIKINQKGYEAIRNHLKSQKEIPTSLLLGACAVLAYGHADEEFKKTIEKVTQENSKTIISDIESLIPEQYSSLNQEGVQYYENLIKTPFSYRLLELLDTPHFPKLFNKRNQYGIGYLLYYLAQNAFAEMDDWFNQTCRIDLKVILINKILDDYSFVFFKNENFQNSKNSIFKAIYAHSKFPLSRFLQLDSSPKDIKDLKDTNFDDNEKLYVALYYFLDNYRASNTNELDNNDKFYKELQFIANSQILNQLNVDLIKEIKLQSFNFETARRLFGVIDNQEVKKSLLAYLLEKLNQTINKDFIIANDLLLANISGRLLLFLGDKYVDKTINLFTKTYQEIYHPFIFNRNNKLWTNNVPKLLYYLISLFVYYKSKDITENLVEYIEKYESVKRDLPHYLNDDLEYILLQISV